MPLTTQTGTCLNTLPWWVSYYLLIFIHFCLLGSCPLWTALYLHQVVVWTIQLLIQLNDQAFKEGRKLSLLFPGLRIKREREKTEMQFLYFFSPSGGLWPCDFMPTCFTPSFNSLLFNPCEGLQARALSSWEITTEHLVLRVGWGYGERWTVRRCYEPLFDISLLYLDHDAPWWLGSFKQRATPVLKQSVILPESYLTFYHSSKDYLKWFWSSRKKKKHNHASFVAKYKLASTSLSTSKSHWCQIDFYLVAIC